MKTVIYLETAQGRRLGVQLANVLAAKGHAIVLMGKKVILPDYTPFEKIVASPAGTVKGFATQLKKVGAEKLISFENLPVCEAAATLNIPFIYAEHETHKEAKAYKNKKALLQKAVRVVIIGNGEKKLNPRVYGDNVVRTPNPAVWVEHYNYNKPACFKKENNIVAAGPFTKEGGMDVLLQTWARLAPAHHTWHLTIVGAGTQKTALSKFITKYHLEPSTELVGNETDLYSLLRNADIYIHPARKAGDLSILLDALASKLPVVATDVKGADELVANGINGLLVNPDEEEPLTIALDELMVNWGKRVSMAVQAVQLKDRYPFEAFTFLFE